MTHDITIPFEAVEAAARAVCAGNKWGQPCAAACIDCLDDVADAFRAAGMLVEWHSRGPGIILPLPQEARDE